MAATPQDQRRVEQTGIPDVRIGAAPTAATFGAGVARVGEDVGLAVYSKAIREADQTAFLAADGALSRKQTEIQIQLSNLKGKDALRAPDALDTAWRKAVDEIDQTLGNEQQRSALQRSAATRYGQLNRSTQLHVNDQMNQFADGETEAFIKSSVDNVRLNPMDPDAIVLEKSRQSAALMEQAQRKGLMGSEIYKQAVASQVSRTNMEVLRGRMVKGLDRAAQAYYDENKDQFTAGDRDVAEKMLDEGSTRSAAQRQAREIIAKNPYDFGEAIKAVEQIDDPKIQQFTRELVKQHVSDLEFQKKRDLDDNYQAIANVVDNAIKKHPGQSFIARNVIPADKWMWLSLPEKSAIQSYIDHQTKPADRPNDDEKWLTFLELPTEDKAKLSRRDYDATYRQHFADSFQTRADGLWQASRAAMERQDQKSPELTQSVTANQQISNTFRTSGLINPDREMGKYSGDEVKMYVRFEQQATAAIEQEELAKQRKLTPTERQGVINGVRDEAIKKVWIPGFLWSSEKAAIAVDEDEKGRASVPMDKIPEQDRQQIHNYITSQGKTATADKIRRAYAQWKVFGNRKGFEAIIAE